MSDFFNATGLENTYRRYHIGLLKALDIAKNASSLSPRWRRIIRKNDLDTASAAVPASAYEAAAAFSAAVERRFHTTGLQHEPELLFVTIIDHAWVKPVNTPPDLDRIRRRLSSIFKGHSTISIIEPAFYANIQDDLGPAKSCISWHSHGLLWGSDRRAVQSLIDGINSSSRYKTLIPSVEPAHCVAVKQGHLPFRVAYMAKPPLKSYRILVRRFLQQRKEQELGISVPPTYWKMEDNLRPGEFIKLFHALKDIDPIDLFVATGDGSDLLRKIRGVLR